MAHDLIGEATFRLLEIAAKGPARRRPDELMVRKMLRAELARLTREQVTA